MMEKHLPSPTGLAAIQIDLLKSILEVLLDPDLKRIGEKYFVYILNNRAGIRNATEVMPFEATQVIIQLEEHKANQAEHTELYRHIFRLYKQNEKLTEHNWELTQEIEKLKKECKVEK